MDDMTKVNRFEVIDHRARQKDYASARLLAVKGAKVSVSLQDGGKTLKVFLSDPPEVV